MKKSLFTVLLKVKYLPFAYLVLLNIYTNDLVFNAISFYFVFHRINFFFKCVNFLSSFKWYFCSPKFSIFICWFKLEKIMKYLLKLSVAICLIFTVSSCTVESLDDAVSKSAVSQNVAEANQSCNNQDPKTKLINNGTVAFTFQIIDSDSNMIEFVDIAPGASTSWISFTEGDTVFNLDSNVIGVSDDKIAISISNCSEIEIVVNAQNKIDSPVVNSLN